MKWLRLHERIPGDPAAQFKLIDGIVGLEPAKPIEALASMETQTHR
jgi:hypothetical protein